MLVLEVQRC